MSSSSSHYCLIIHPPCFNTVSTATGKFRFYPVTLLNLPLFLAMYASIFLQILLPTPSLVNNPLSYNSSSLSSYPSSNKIGVEGLAVILVSEAIDEKTAHREFALIDQTWLSSYKGIHVFGYVRNSRYLFPVTSTTYSTTHMKKMSEPLKLKTGWEYLQVLKDWQDQVSPEYDWVLIQRVNTFTRINELLKVLNERPKEEVRIYGHPRIDWSAPAMAQCLEMGWAISKGFQRLFAQCSAGAAVEGGDVMKCLALSPEFTGCRSIDQRMRWTRFVDLMADPTFGMGELGDGSRIIRNWDTMQGGNIADALLIGGIPNAMVLSTLAGWYG